MVASTLRHKRWLDNFFCVNNILTFTTVHRKCKIGLFTTFLKIIVVYQNVTRIPKCQPDTENQDEKNENQDEKNENQDEKNDNRVPKC